MHEGPPRPAGDLLADLPLELEIAALAARPVWCETTRRRAGWLARRLDPALLVETVDCHGLGAATAQLLAGIETSASPELERLHRQALARSLVGEHDLVSVLDLLEGERIPALAFKGPSLAHLAYARPELREYLDLDLLVAAEHVREARELLLARGYKDSYENQSGPVRAKFLVGDQLCLIAVAEGHPAVELHWRLGRARFPFGLTQEELWIRAQRVEVGGRAISTMGAEDLLVYLCLHGAKHLWSRFRWVADLAHWARRAGPTLDWDRVEQTARAAGAGPALEQGLAVARGLLGVLTPHRSPRGAAALVEPIRACWLREPQVPWDKLGQSWRLAQGRRARLRVALNFLLDPDDHEFEDLPALPPVLFPLYRAYRVQRLARTFAGEGLRRLVGRKRSRDG
jgi:Uncharacterised nucleotidyltransferase